MATATQKKVTKGFKVRCPYCGVEDTLSVRLDDVHAMTCSDCSSDVTPEDIRETIEAWSKLLAWLDTAPPIG